MPDAASLYTGEMLEEFSNAPTLGMSLPQLYPDVSMSALLIRLPLQGVMVAIAYWLTRPSLKSTSFRRSPA